MTRICHSRCLQTNNLELDSECITSCYHKYISTINKMQKLTLEKGKITKSEFVYKIFDPEKDLIEEYIFPQTGTYIYIPSWAIRPSNYKIYPRTGYNPFKNIWELR